MKGYIHSFQSLGTVDGPGVRFVVFFQGCPLRCAYCHNPDTWVMSEGRLFEVEDVLKRVSRFRSYFGAEGGITASGGEPLMQAPFLRQLFAGCREQGIHTCLDTAAMPLNEDVRAVLDVTDRVLLDVKFSTEEEYKRYANGSLETVKDFLDELEQRRIPVTVRRVIVPTLNDTQDETDRLIRWLEPYSCVDGIELLPFRKLCTVKYEQLGIPFPFADLPAADEQAVRSLAARYPLCLK